MHGRLLQTIAMLMAQFAVVNPQLCTDKEERESLAYWSIDVHGLIGKGYYWVSINLIGSHQAS